MTTGSGLRDIHRCDGADDGANVTERPAASIEKVNPMSTTSNPMRIARIGTDHIQVVIRPAVGRTELLGLVERLERIIDAGYDAVEVVVEGAMETTSLARPAPAGSDGESSGR